MELEDLKQTWKQTDFKKNKNTDIMQLIQQKNYGPLVSLKKEFRKQMRIMLALPVLLIATNMQNIDTVLTSVLFWSYVAFCLGIVAYAYYNQRIVRRMEHMDGMVRANLEQQVDLLEKRLRWKVVGLRAVLLYFVVLLEVLPYFQHYRMLATWHALHPVIRFGAYAALFVFQYFVGKQLIQRKFISHVKYLKELVRQMQS